MSATQPPLVAARGLAWHAGGRRILGPLELAVRSGERLAVVGGGDSAWRGHPRGHGYPQYVAATAALFARLDCSAVDLVGTSMGGLIGMMLAAQPDSPIRRLVVNDVGPFIPQAGLERILDYFGKDPFFEDLAAAEAYHRTTYAGFGALSDAQWRHLTETSLRRDGEGWRLHYDPRIAEPWRNIELEDVNLWPVWDAIAIPVLVLRGAASDLLLAETAAEMAARGPRARVTEIAGCGHAPALLDATQTKPLRDWLNAE